MISCSFNQKKNPRIAIITNVRVKESSLTKKSFLFYTVCSGARRDSFFSVLCQERKTTRSKIFNLSVARQPKSATYTSPWTVSKQVYESCNSCWCFSCCCCCCHCRLRTSKKCVAEKELSFPGFFCSVQWFNILVLDGLLRKSTKTNLYFVSIEARASLSYSRIDYTVSWKIKMKIILAIYDFFSSCFHFPLGWSL